MAGSDTIREREKIAKEIAKTSESIRKKHRALKTGKIDDDIVVKTHFRPIIEPLQKIVDNSIAVKNESDSNVKIATLPTVKRYKEEEEEEEETPKKRKRLHANRNIPRVRNILTPHTSNVSLHEPLITSTPSTSTQSATTKIVQPTVPESLENDNVFETTGNSLETSVRNLLHTHEGQEALREHFGPLGQQYMGTLLGGDEKKEIDHVYGVYFDKNEMRLGNKRFDVDMYDSIIIDKVKYIGTPGLYELIFKRIPDDDIYTDDDMYKYKSILLATNAHKRNYDAQGQLLSNRGYKYKHIIAPLLPIAPKKKKSGRGVSMPRTMTLSDNKIDYVHWD
ncbi:hypothetical protein RF55_16132, partial [Lasius niger]